MSASINDTSKAWSKIAEKWITYFKPPSRPSNDEVQQYKKWIEAQNPKNALVLGATPELLDVLSELNISTDIIDINEEMVSAMMEIAEPSKVSRNITISNWLDMPYENNSFDVILGDAVIQNVPFESREAMIEQIHRVLSPNGAYINRSFCVPETKAHNNIDEILDAFKDKEINETTAIELVYEIQVLNYDSNAHLAAMSDVRKTVEPLRKGDKFHRASEKENQLLNILWNYWLNEISDKVWVYDKRSNEEATLYKSFFDIAGVFEANDHPYGDVTPLYFLKKL